MYEKLVELLFVVCVVSFVLDMVVNMFRPVLHHSGRVRGDFSCIFVVVVVVWFEVVVVVAAFDDSCFCQRPKRDAHFLYMKNGNYFG